MNDQLQKRIMRRVYAVFFMKRAVGPTALKLYTLMLASAGIVSLVSVGNVFANMPADIAGVLVFVFYALSHTEFIVQLFVFGTLGAALWLVRDIVQGLQEAPHLHRM